MDFQIIKLMMMIWLIRISKTWDFSCITKVSNRPAIDFNEMRTTVLMNCNKWRQADQSGKTQEQKPEWNKRIER